MVAGKLKVGVKYCGHCNPQEEGPALIRRLQQRLPGLVVVHWDVLDYNVLLVVNACAVGCATRPAFNGPIIEIVPGEVRDCKVPTGHSAERLLEVFLDEGIKVIRCRERR